MPARCCSMAVNLECLLRAPCHEQRGDAATNRRDLPHKELTGILSSFCPSCTNRAL